jgi:PDDEXK-like domain of unknown function (DUF3799)
VRPETPLPALLDLDAASYHRDELDDGRPSLSASLAKILIGQSPAHAWTAHPRLNPDFKPEDAQKFDRGTASHQLLLEDDESRWAIVPEIYTNWKTNAAKEVRDTAREYGQIPLLASTAAEIRTMVHAARLQLAINEADPKPFTNGKPEQVIAWEENGILCRALIDWLHDDWLTLDDYKTTAVANPDQWTKRTLFDIGADVQAEFYGRGVEAITGKRPEFRFIVQETSAPYQLSVVGLGPDVMALAKKKVDRAIDLWARCLRNDAWPGYPTRVCWAELPAWEETRWLEKEMRDAA